MGPLFADRFNAYCNARTVDTNIEATLETPIY